MKKTMAQENNKQQFQCTGNCLNCLPAQRQYCASQHSYSNMKVLDNMMELLKKMQDSVTELNEKVDAMQGGEASVFAPNSEAELFPKEFKKTEE